MQKMDLLRRYASAVMIRYGCTINIPKSCVLILLIKLIIKSEYDFRFVLLCRYSLFQLVVTDNWGRGRTVMFAWTKKEKRADVTWILDKFKEIMGNTTKTETFVMDCARSESAAVRITHGHANIILCAFHVIRAFRKKTNDKILKTYLTRLVTAETVGRFNQYYRIINRRDSDRPVPITFLDAT
ncbi:unnamed protein product [Schistosoma curassoni]|nr:unnamed protein product [Schistosoma curassoni]